MAQARKHYRLNQKQLHILMLLYKFRFITIPLLTTYKNLKSNSLQRTFDILVEETYVGKKFNPTYKIDRRPAIYYLTAKGVAVLKSDPRFHPAMLHSFYKNTSVGDAFIQHAVDTLDVYNALKQSYGDRFEMFTKQEVAHFEDFPETKPDLYLRGNQDYIITLAHDTPLFLTKKRLTQYIAHFEEEGWANGDYPVLLFIFADSLSQRRFLRFATTSLDNAGNEVEVNGRDAARLFVRLEDSGLIADGQPTDDFYAMSPELRAEKIGEVLAAVSPELAPHAENALLLLESVYDPKKHPMVSNARAKATLNLNQEKFASKEFKRLWEKINSKTYYTVQFDEAKLIDSCVNALNTKLRVSKTTIVITEGYLKSTKQDSSPEMKKLVGREVVLEEIASRGVTYDLVGEIATVTRLTRRSVAEIISRIIPARFDLFAANPEEFIREAIKLIDEQKASTIIEHITYDKLDEQWSAEEIFVDATITGEYGQNVVDAKKHIFDKLRYDSSVEKDFGAELDIADMVELYVKLPGGFYINTPMGKYNPDWAISFKEGSVKHIYFVAETKGDTSDMQLREVEKAKIECARRHFSVISSDAVRYSAVSSYADLLKVVNA